MLLAIDKVCEELHPNVGIRRMLVNMPGAHIVPEDVPLLLYTKEDVPVIV